MLYTALILGLLGSFHCIGMCGPIAFMLPLDRRSQSKKIVQIISYHSGRLFTYGLIGLLFGVLGKSFNLFGVQQQLSIAIGIGMIGLVLIPNRLLNQYSLSKPLYRWVGKVKSSLGAALKRKDPGTFFTVGFLNGFLPCGLVYVAVFGAIATPHILYSGLYMVLFGLGTIPLMTSAIYLGNFFSGKLRKKLLKLIPVVVVIIGVLFILRGMGLGIPYISPADNVVIEQIGSSHSCH